MERKTSDAGAFASQLAVSSEGRGGPVKVAGTVAGGEPRMLHTMRGAGYVLREP